MFSNEKIRELLVCQSKKKENRPSKRNTSSLIRKRKNKEKLEKLLRISSVHPSGLEKRVIPLNNMIYHLR